MYAWIWRSLPGTWQARLAIAAGLVAAACALLWYVIFPWLEPKVQFDHGVVNGTPTAPATTHR
ncbi:hypothetical protein [Actinomadura parmotrematis]|uniref:DUF4175 domain-containing protein n=1 Tax=Actinomadura parmotrematis TaxID=2864039 RepID=A0ABS7FN55_9ACTN|nr:hypothetical protein [Actinomadura parmotrematis]MBW8481817.1 hypothetical protein [Actinomadura parmotrematis]